MKKIKRFMQKNNYENYVVEYPDGYLTITLYADSIFITGVNFKKDIIIEFIPVKSVREFCKKCRKLLYFNVRICKCCGKPINEGCTDDENTFYCCDECFSQYMNKTYGKNNWRESDIKDNQCNFMGGFYDIYCGQWIPVDVYYTEWY